MLQSVDKMTKIKDFFKLNWPVFILFVIFNLIAQSGLFQLGAAFGKHMGFGLFNPFSFFSQLGCIEQWWTLACAVWNPFLKIIVPILNVIWAFFLANLVMFVYGKVRKK